MKSLQFNKDQYTETIETIGGIQVYLYNLDTILQAAKEHQQHQFQLNVAYIFHPRTDYDHTFSASIAYNILEKYYNQKKSSQGHLLCIAWDNPNHGARTVDKLKNQTWGKGNQSHATDMVAIINQLVEEIKLVMDALPAKLNLEQYLPHIPNLEEEELETRVVYHNSISGYSMGAHASIRFGSKYPNLVAAINPVVGCSDLSSLLVARLQQGDDCLEIDGKKKFYFTYEELGLNEQRNVYYPRSLHKLIAAQDLAIFENFAGNGVKVFAAFGEKDKLVPAEFTSSWVKMIGLNDGVSTSFTDDSAGHEVTQEMVDKFVSWFIGNIAI